MKFLTSHRKYFVALIPFGLGLLEHYVGKGSFEYREVVMFLTAAGVWAVSNDSAPPADDGHTQGLPLV